MDPFRGGEIAGSPGRCPRCLDMPLELKQARELTIAMCGRCRGVWLDGAGLLELFTASEGSLIRLAQADGLSIADRPAPAACPRCRRVMLRETGSSGLVYDACGLHGLWFDPGELRALLVHAGIQPDRDPDGPPRGPEPPPHDPGPIGVGDVAGGADLVIRILGTIAEIFGRTMEDEGREEEPAGSSAR